MYAYTCCRRHRRGLWTKYHNRYVSSIDLTIGADWTPFATEAKVESNAGPDPVATSRFEPLAGTTASTRNDALWLFVSRRARDRGARADTVTFTLPGTSTPMCYYDL